MAPTATREAPPQAVLDLRDKTPNRPFMRLGEDVYHYKLKTDLSIDQLLRAMKTAEKLQSLGEGGSSDFEILRAMNGRQRRRFRKDVEHAVETVMFDMPTKVIRGLSDGERLAILASFPNALEANATKQPAPSRTKSRGSAASTRSRRKK